MRIASASLLVAVSIYLSYPIHRTRLRIPLARKFKSKIITADQLLHFALSFRLELESGAMCESALGVALETLPHDALPLTRSAIDKRRGIVEAMHRDAIKLPLLRDLSLAIALSQKQGSQLGGSLKIMTDVIQDRIQTQQLLRSELASVRATIAVLATLPLLGTGFATLLGARPIPWLFGSSFGRSCLILALIFETLGLLWTRALVVRALQDQR